MTTNTATFDNVVATYYSGNGGGLTGIPRNGIAPGTPSEVLVNDISGTISSVAQLALAQGGTSADLSGFGAGPFTMSVSNDSSNLLSYTSAATATTIVGRDGSGSSAFNVVMANSVTSVGTLTLSGSTISVLDPISLVSGAADTTTYFTRAGAGTILPLTVLSVSTATGTAMFVKCEASLGTSPAATGIIRVIYKATNVAGVVQLSTVVDKLTVLDTGVSAAQLTVTNDDEFLQVNISGILGNWAIKTEITTIDL
jgi:hypothetical protein